MTGTRGGSAVSLDTGLRVLAIAVLGLWATGGGLVLLRGGPGFEGALVLGGCLALAAARARRSPLADRAAAGLLVAAFAAFVVHLRRHDVDFAGWIAAGAGVVTVACFLHALEGSRSVALGVVALPCLGVLGFLGLLYVHDAAAGIRTPYAQRVDPHPRWPELGAEWRMHEVDNPGDLLPNGLDGADVNGDGYDDYLTNYEARGRVRVAVHPRRALALGFQWAAYTVGRVPNAESSALGDLDGDGAVDAVVVHGVEGTRLPPGVRVYWNILPETGPAFGPQFRDAGDIPSSRGGWHFLTVRCVDLDGDGDLDVVAGGRASRMAFGDKQAIASSRDLTWAGLRWFENPGGSRDAVRDLTRWPVHAIDPRSRSGHGFELGDLDGDGDLDLANANSDFDTPEDEEDVAWYENPGPGAALRDAWPRHELLRSDEFYAKEQVVIADLDGDGRSDVLVHAPERIHWLRNRGPAPGSATPRFEPATIPKHESARWRARPLEAADLDGDGDLELIGALIHRDGALPADRAALFWMDRDGDAWTTHVVKWADGFWGLGAVNGEKWDQIIPRDVDRDGDLDLVANVEEYNRLQSILAVVWFENPRIDGP